MNLIRSDFAYTHITALVVFEVAANGRATSGFLLQLKNTDEVYTA
jgi:hypothetical protein